MKKLKYFLLFTFLSSGINAQTFIPAYQSRAQQVSQTNINTLLQEFAGFGVKTTGSVANNNAFNWLKSKYQSYGYANSQISEDVFNYGNSTSKNLIITKTGTVYPNTFVIICAHYDTVSGQGVNDNGSGTSILLEAARILKDVPTEYSVKFIHFSGEEQGLLGSSHYVNNVVFSNSMRQMNIKVVFNIDQVGGKIGNSNTHVTCESDQSGQSGNNAASLSMTQQLATCTTLYSPLQTHMAHAYASDYMPFENKGDIITGFYERTRSYTEHSSNDTFANIDPVYVYNVGKASVGALQHFAIASSTLNSKEAKISSLEKIKIYPNPTKNTINIEVPKDILEFKVELKDTTGRIISTHENENKIDVSLLENGIYFCTLYFGQESETRKIIIEK